MTIFVRGLEASRGHGGRRRIRGLQFPREEPRVVDSEGRDLSVPKTGRVDREERRQQDYGSHSRPVATCDADTESIAAGQPRISQLWSLAEGRIRFNCSTSTGVSMNVRMNVGDRS
jgi:hypothetical protein